MAVLAGRVLASPQTPWIFYRKEWDWEWRSWRRVADQVSRGAAVLRGWDSKGGTRVAFDARPDLDSVAVGLAIQAAGATAVPLIGRDQTAIEEAARLGCAAWVGVEGEMPAAPILAALESIALPAALSALDRTQRQRLEIDAESVPGSLAFPGPTETLLSAETLMTAARLLERRIPATDRQSIVGGAPGLTPQAVQLLQAWTLVRGAAWVLEPLADAFLPTMLWARPTVVFGPAAELRELSTELSTRKHRRHSRLTAIVVAGGEPVDDAVWTDLNVAVVALGKNPLESLLGDSS